MHIRRRVVGTAKGPFTSRRRSETKVGRNVDMLGGNGRGNIHKHP